MNDAPPAMGTTLAVHSGALGDLVLFGRLLSELPPPVTLVTGSEKGKLLAGLGAVAAALDFDALPIHEVFSDTPLGECTLPARLGTHDRLISCFAAGDRKAELRLAALCGAGDAAFLPIRPPADARGHLLELWRDLLGLVEPGAAQRAKSFEVPQAWHSAAAEQLTAMGIGAQRRVVVIHPGAGAAEKCWPLERFVDLARHLQHSDVSNFSNLSNCDGPPLAVLFVVGPVECDRWADGEIEALAKEFPVLSRAPLATLSAVLAAGALFVGNDAGVSHLAATLGAPTVAVFGPSRAEHFAPRGPHVEIVAASQLADIPVDTVCAAASRALRK